MEKLLKPKSLAANPNDPDSQLQYQHWQKTFDNFLACLSAPAEGRTNKLALLENCVAANVYKYISSATGFDDAINKLKAVYIKQKNVVFARYVLSTTKQGSAQSIADFVQQLRQLSKGLQLRGCCC